MDGAIELVDRALVKAWVEWALAWLTIFSFVCILVSIQFHNPEFLGGIDAGTLSARGWAHAMSVH